MRLIRWHPPLERSVRSALVAWLLLTSLGCATVLGSWDYGLPKDNLPTEDRLWHIVFPLSVAAADQCVFKREIPTASFLKTPLKHPSHMSESDISTMIRKKRFICGPCLHAA